MHSSQIFSNIFPFSVPCPVHGLCMAGAQQCPLQCKHYEVVTSTIALNNSTKTLSLQIKNKWFQTEPNPVYALHFPRIQFSSQHLIASGPLQDSQPTVNATLSFFEYRRKKVQLSWGQSTEMIVSHQRPSITSTPQARLRMIVWRIWLQCTRKRLGADLSR